MAKKNTAVTDTAVETTAEVKETAKKAVVDCKYSISDFVATHDKFNTSDIVVKTALELSKKTEFTVEEATEIIEKFKNKEV